MKVVILCGGLGTRMREETEFRPKPLVEVGEGPFFGTFSSFMLTTGFAILCSAWATRAT